MTLNYDPSEMTLNYPLSEASDSRPHPLNVAQVLQDSKEGSRPNESKEVKFPLRSVIFPRLSAAKDGVALPPR